MQEKLLRGPFSFTWTLGAKLTPREGPLEKARVQRPCFLCSFPSLQPWESEE